MMVWVAEDGEKVTRQDVMDAYGTTIREVLKHAGSLRTPCCTPISRWQKSIAAQTKGRV